MKRKWRENEEKIKRKREKKALEGVRFHWVYAQEGSIIHIACWHDDPVNPHARSIPGHLL